ncbi:MAG: MGMT family protein [Cytophagaceae bacterium]|jgi:methylated-DNA-protein-cysteine methyltransferase-like protein|nr:MGMT family protein [Cytophagaceae bacterium]
MKNEIYIEAKKDFFEQVYAVVRLVPFGRVTSYGAIAAFIGLPQWARMVGWALNKAGSQTEFVPAHRVVNRTGTLTGQHSFSGKTTMKELLKNEGIVIEDDKIAAFDKVFWNPITDLSETDTSFEAVCMR